ncbi:hypothetical protein [Actinokineospora inagensis]|uniref:hypothetical protein n=1 Tax=Actinokineospora inagensis TaxID=103730 RepID=UPI000411215B|nr:hypothetical protein [Actinokineospora inagensis]
MKTTLSTAVSALALLLLAGCGGTADQANQAPTPGSTQPGSATTAGGSAAPTGSAAPQTGPAPTKAAVPQVGVAPDGKVTVPAGFRELPATQVDAKALPDTYKERRVWASQDGKQLQLIGLANDSCAGVDAQLAEQTDSALTVVLTPMTSPQGGTEGGKMCATVVTPRPVEVPLDQPVGDRKVVVTAANQ